MNFRIYLDGEDFGVFEYSDKDKCYHQKETGWYILTINDIKRAIIDNNYFIKIMEEN